MPQISVIVPVYKVEKYINRCVDSILAQTLTDFELILVDDGSPDNCGTICDEYAAKDSRIHVIHQKNGGLSAARNAGIDWAFTYSDSEWLSFVDSDDWVHPRYLEMLFQGVMKYSSDISICNFEKCNQEQPYRNVNSVCPEEVDVETFYREKVVTATTAWGKLYRKKLFQDMRYPLGKNQEDEWVTYKLLFQNKRIVLIPTALYFYFDNISGIMHTLKANDIISEIDAQKERIEFFLKIGKQDLYEWQLLSHIKLLATQISNSAKYEFTTSQVENLKKRLRMLLSSKEGRKVCPFIEKNMWIYSRAFPKCVALYSTFEVIKRKIGVNW